MHRGILAPMHFFGGLEIPESRRGGDEHHELRWAVDAASDREAWIWHLAGKFYPRRTARVGGYGEKDRAGEDRGVHD